MHTHSCTGFHTLHSWNCSWRPWLHFNAGNIDVFLLKHTGAQTPNGSVIRGHGCLKICSTACIFMIVFVQVKGSVCCKRCVNWWARGRLFASSNRMLLNCHSSAALISALRISTTVTEHTCIWWNTVTNIERQDFKHLGSPSPMLGLPVAFKLVASTVLCRHKLSDWYE